MCSIGMPQTVYPPSGTPARGFLWESSPSGSPSARREKGLGMRTPKRARSNSDSPHTASILRAVRSMRSRVMAPFSRMSSAMLMASSVTAPSCCR